MTRMVQFGALGVGQTYGYAFIGPTYDLPHLTVHGNGNTRLGTGTTAPTQRLYVEGSAFKTDGSTTWQTTSDSRTKRNVRPWTHGLQTILQLPDPQMWEYNGKAETPKGKKAIGLMAEAVRSVLPDAVQETEQVIDGQPVLAIDYHPIMITLIVAVKELARAVEPLIKGERT